jgi:hypothetical protein
MQFCFEGWVAGFNATATEYCITSKGRLVLHYLFILFIYLFILFIYLFYLFIYLFIYLFQSIIVISY